ncbi:MAG: aminotransferase class V-fold PLP-dependent enzyme [Robiginitomaculum sp.]|nr:aminotransferase class V-fold PLP-dependent enzyme [Robiginitomaculum sp.]
MEFMLFRRKKSIQQESSDYSLANIRTSIIGHDHVLPGPFGSRKIFYADYVASGRSFQPIEDSIQQHVLPLYANTHTEASATGRQTSAFREQARQIISKAIGATEDDAVLFCGSGCTGAIDKLIQILGLKLPDGLDKYGLKAAIAPEKRPVVFIGPYEHHSNDVQWRETIADVITIEETADGLLDIDDLERQLDIHKDRPLLIGSFSTASNVTGIITDPVPVAKLLHQYGALAAFDYAAAAPYVPIDINQPDNAYFDAIYISPHKYLGGPGTPGILVVKKKWASNKTPVIPGGGTVSYVSPCAQTYLDDICHREEGGTPDIIGSIRAGLVFDLKQKIGDDLIAAAEESLAKQALKHWVEHPNIQILGSQTAKRLPIFSFLVKSNDKFLHYNFVVALLDDLFGIQARGGCSCAGPYGHRLLDIDLETSQEYEKIISTGLEILKPGWVRVGFNYFNSRQEAELLITAIEWIAYHGHLLLPLYDFDCCTGRWTHHLRKGEALSRLDALHCQNEQKRAPVTIQQMTNIAESQIKIAASLPSKPKPQSLQETPEHLLWFRQD